MEIALVLTVGTLCIVCFLIGAKVGQTVTRGEEIKLPNIDPMAAHREREERKAAAREQDRVSTILENINNYDGTGKGQKDVPRG
jgi:hypothetical protein